MITFSPFYYLTFYKSNHHYFFKDNDNKIKWIPQHYDPLLINTPYSTIMDVYYDQPVINEVNDWLIIMFPSDNSTIKKVPLQWGNRIKDSLMNYMKNFNKS